MVTLSRCLTVFTVYLLASAPCSLLTSGSGKCFRRSTSPCSYILQCGFGVFGQTPPFSSSFSQREEVSVQQSWRASAFSESASWCVAQKWSSLLAPVAWCRQQWHRGFSEQIVQGPWGHSLVSSLAFQSPFSSQEFAGGWKFFALFRGERWRTGSGQSGWQRRPQRLPPLVRIVFLLYHQTTALNTFVRFLAINFTKNCNKNLNNNQSSTVFFLPFFLPRGKSAV